MLFIPVCTWSLVILRPWLMLNIFHIFTGNAELRLQWKISPHPCLNGKKSKKTTNNKCCENVGGENNPCVGGNINCLSNIQKEIGRSSKKKYSTIWPSNTLFWGIYQDKARYQRDICIPYFMAYSQQSNTNNQSVHWQLNR